MTVRAVLKRPGEPATYITLPAEGPAQYAELKRLVGGYVEMIKMGRYTAILNEEGIPQGLPWNIWLGEESPIAGNLVVGAAADDTEEGPFFEDLNENGLKMIATLLNAAEPIHGKASFESFQTLVGRPAIQVLSTK